MATKNDYLQYLADAGYSEDEVLAMLDPTEFAKQGLKSKMALAQLMGIAAKLLQDESETNRNFAEHIFKSMANNTNYLLQSTIDGRLKKRFSETGVVYRDGLFPGVFPTNDFNARAISKFPGLVLIDTACIEIIETVIRLFMSDASNAELIGLIAKVIEKLQVQRRLPETHERDHPSFQRPEIAGRNIYIIEYTTSSEEFVLAHEYAHYSMGHNDRLATSSLDRKRLEFEADSWAAEALLRPNSLWDPKDGIETQIAGIFVVLGIAHVIECINRKHELLTYDEGYPTAIQRFQNIYLLLKQGGLLPKINAGAQVFETLLAVGEYVRDGKLSTT